MAERPTRSAGGLLSLLPQAGPDEPPPEEESVDPTDDALRAASDAVFDAMTTGDRLGFRNALRSFVNIERMGGGG